MLLWIIQISIISLILIFLVHHLYFFFVSTLTVPKVKDLVNSPIEKYQNMFNTINTYKEQSYTNIELLPTDNDDVSVNSSINVNMKDELKSFLKKQMGDFSLY
jgi:hypothetical protein